MITVHTGILKDTIPASQFLAANGNFATFHNEFKYLDDNEIIKDNGSKVSSNEKLDQKRYNLLYEQAVVFTLLILISYLIKFENFRKSTDYSLLLLWFSLDSTRKPVHE